MRCYTINDGSVRNGLRVHNLGEEAGVTVGDTTVVVEPRIRDHLRAVEAALWRRVNEDYNPAEILGEINRAELTKDDAGDMVEEVLDGWYIDHLTFDPEAHLLMHAAPYDRERRCLIAVYTSGRVDYMSNVTEEEKVERDRVVRAFRPLAAAAGVTILGSGVSAVPHPDDSKKVLTEVSGGLFMLAGGASFRLHRARSQAVLKGSTGWWMESLVSWNGFQLNFRVFQGGRKRRTAA